MKQPYSMRVYKISMNLDVFLDTHYKKNGRDDSVEEQISLYLVSTLNWWDFSVPEIVKQQAQIK